MNEKTVHQLAGHKKLEDEYVDPNMLPKINKSDIAGMMEAMEKHPRLHCAYGYHWHTLFRRP